MYPIYVGKLGTGIGMNVDDFEQNFLRICSDHQEQGRASLFAFILHEPSQPQVMKVLFDTEYFKALDYLSGFDLTVFYLALNSENQGITSREEIDQHYNSTAEVKDHLRATFELEKDIDTPTILFFQVENSQIIDFFFISLEEKKIEESFLEIQSAIENVVQIIKRVSPENRNNYSEIFYLVEDSINSSKKLQIVRSAVKKAFRTGEFAIFVKEILSLII